MGAEKKRGWIVHAYVTRLDECGSDGEGMGFVEHALDEPFHCVLGGTVRRHTGNSECSGR